MSTRAIATALALGIALSATLPASAQTLALEDRAVLRLERERLSQRGERKGEALVLLTYGLASVVLGALAAGIGHEDPFWVGAGIGTAGWGAVNAALSLGMMDLGGDVARSIEEDRAGLRGSLRIERREELAREQYTSATVFAVNAGLDVLYVAGGVLIAVIANLISSPEPTLEGYGVAMAVQGAGLLAFDVVEWIRSLERGDRLLRLDRGEE